MDFTVGAAARVSYNRCGYSNGSSARKVFICQNCESRILYSCAHEGAHVTGDQKAGLAYNETGAFVGEDIEEGFEIYQMDAVSQLRQKKRLS